MTNANPEAGSQPESRGDAQDGRALWERPVLRRLAMSGAEGGGPKVNPDPGGGKTS